MGEFGVGAGFAARGKMSEPGILEYLSELGFRETVPRRAVVTVALRMGRFTAAEIVEELRGQGIGRATVFRTLDLLTSLGVLDQLHSDSRHAYTVCSPRHHHHLICSACSKVVEVTAPPVERAVRALAEKAGYEMQGHLLEIIGLCADCQASRMHEASR
jgi:Fur family ferric uptake transcriptional regulator